MKPNPSPSDSQFEKFREFTKQIISVPKSEIDHREKEYKAERKAAKKRRKL